MRFFLDTEFMESPGNLELLSIALVAGEDHNSEYYVEVEEADRSLANDWVRVEAEYYVEVEEADRSLANDWVRANVLPQMTGPVKPRATIAQEIREFVDRFSTPVSPPEFWGYYADYDWVVFCWLFGAMIDLPKGWPMYCRDLKQWADMMGNPRLPEVAADGQLEEHHALVDARWNQKAWKFLNRVERER